MFGRPRPAATRSTLTDADKQQWEEHGFLVLPGFFTPDEMARVDRLIETAWRERRRPDNPLVIDVLEGPLKDRRMHFRHAPDEAKALPYKLNDLYLVSRELREIVLDPRLVAVLHDLISGYPAVCNSLCFERGSQQAYHFDTYYMPGPCPDGLVVTSICLEDMLPDAGPLTYYPGSHTIPPYRFSHGGIHAVPEEMDTATKYAFDEIEARGLTAVDFAGHTGDVFVWHEQLYHGGRPIRDLTLTRKSLVTHYWRADALHLDPGWKLESQGRNRF
jgi:hypothetical protein